MWEVANGEDATTDMDEWMRYISSVALLSEHVLKLHKKTLCWNSHQESFCLNHAHRVKIFNETRWYPILE